MLCTAFTLQPSNGSAITSWGKGATYQDAELPKSLPLMCELAAAADVRVALAAAFGLRRVRKFNINMCSALTLKLPKHVECQA